MADINIGAISEALNNKVDLSGSWGFPINNSDSLTLGASGTSYVAPADGYFALRKLSSGSNQNIRMFSTGSIASSVISYASGNNLEAFVPIKKGNSCAIYYSAGGTTEDFRFYYAQKTN